MRGAITQFKYHGEWARAAYLGQSLASVVADLQPIDAIVPVPLHPARLRHRGFNQSSLLARQAGEILNVEVHDALIRTRRTDAQVTLDAMQREANVAGAFAIAHGKTVEGLSVVLVDDVVTTGSTLSACADALIDAGASSVRAASVAREM
jgi:ComF family protein